MISKKNARYLGRGNVGKVIFEVQNLETRKQNNYFCIRDGKGKQHQSINRNIEIKYTELASQGSHITHRHSHN